MSEQFSASTRELPPYVSRDKAREMLGECSITYLYKLLGQQRIRGVKAGGKLLIVTASIGEYLDGLPRVNIAPPRKSPPK